jgi:hypothetical protein
MGASTEQIDSFAKLGVKVITLQLSLASKEASDAADEAWPLGYCFGVFDALGRRANFDQYTDGFALITIGFLILFGKSEGAIHLRRALDLQTEKEFFEGNNEGGSDVFEWLEKNDYQPLALMNYFAFGGHASKP